MVHPVRSRLLSKMVFVLLINIASYTVSSVPVRAMGCEGNSEACQGEGFDGCCDGTCECMAGENHEICTCACC